MQYRSRYGIFRDAMARAGSRKTITPFASAPASGITPVAFDAATNGNGFLTFNHTCAGTNRYLVIEIAMGNGADTFSGVTYNGVAMTQLRRTSGGFGSELWGLANPASGTNSVVITRGTGSTGLATGAISFKNVDQTTPVEAGSAGGSSGSGITTLNGPSQTTNSGGMVVEGIGSNSITATGSTQTGWNDGGGDGGFYLLGTGSAQQTSYTVGVGNYALASVALNAVGSTGSGAAYTEANTAAWVMTASSTEVHEIPDAATVAYVLTASAAEVHEIPDSATAAFAFTAASVESHEIPDAATAQYVLTASAIEGAGATFTDSATCAFVFTALPNATPMSLLHDTFTRTTVSDWGTSDSGLTYTHLTGTATQEYVSTDHAVMKAPSGVSTTLVQSANIPNSDSRIRVVAQSSVLTSQVLGQNMLFGIRTRSDLVTSGNNYEFRFNVASSGALTMALVRNDAGAATTLVASTTIYSSGNWVLTDQFIFEVICEGTLLQAWYYKTTDPRQAVAPVSYDISGDATQYLSGAAFQFRHLSNGTPTGDEEWDIYDLDIYALTEVVTDVDANTATTTFTPSATETMQDVDVSTVGFVFTPSAPTDIHTTTDAGTAAFAFTSSDVQLFGGIDAATAAFVFTPSTTDVQAMADTATAAWVMTTSAVELHTIFDAATAAWVMTTSAVDVLAGVDAATAQYVLTAGGTEFQSSGNADAATIAWVMTPSAADVAAMVDAATASFVFTPSATENMQDVDTATASFVFTTSTVAEGYGTLDSATGQWVMTASAAEIHEIPDSATASFVFTAGGTDVFQPATGDSATVAWVMTPSAAVESRGTIDSALISYVLTAAAATEVRTVSDAGTSTFVYTAGGTDLWVAGDTGAAQWVFTPGSTQLFAGVDAGQVQYVLTPASVAEVFGKIDVGTAQWVNTASGLDERVWSDSGQAQFFYTAGTPFEFLVQDADTAFFSFDSSAVEGVGSTEGAICTFNYSAFATESFTGVDTSQVDVAFFVFTAGTIEIQQILDYYLEAVQFSRWAATQTHHFDVIQSTHYTVSQTNRWSVVYKGRGLLSG